MMINIPNLTFKGKYLLAVEPDQQHLSRDVCRTFMEEILTQTKLHAT